MPLLGRCNLQRFPDETLSTQRIRIQSSSRTRRFAAVVSGLNEGMTGRWKHFCLLPITYIVVMCSTVVGVSAVSRDNYDINLPLRRFFASAGIQKSADAPHSPGDLRHYYKRRQPGSENIVEWDTETFRSPPRGEQIPTAKRKANLARPVPMPRHTDDDEDFHTVRRYFDVL